MAQPIRIMAMALLVLALGAPGHPTLASGGAFEWTRQFGTSGADEAQGVAIDSEGNAHVVGWFGTLPGQSLSGHRGRLRAQVRLQRKRGLDPPVGEFRADFARAVAVDQAGDAYVVGETHGTLPGQSSAGGYDAFVRKYDPAGNELWTRQFGGAGEGAWGVALDAAGNAHVVGTTRAALPQQSPAGSFDAFVRKYDAAGNEVWTRQFGSEGGEGARGVALTPTGNILVVGSTDGVLPGRTTAGGFDAYVRQYNPAGDELWTQQFGTEADDYGVGVAVGPSGHVSVVGSTDLALPGQNSAGGTDAFLRQFDLTGAALWTRQFGSDTSDDAWGVAIDADGHGYVVGSTERTLSGQRSAGRSDSYLRKYDTGGRDLWTRQFGSRDTDLALSVSVDAAGRPRIVGSTRGTLPGQRSAGDRDAFVMSLN
jgi:hypothetical protein